MKRNIITEAVSLCLQQPRAFHSMQPGEGSHIDRHGKPKHSPKALLLRFMPQGLLRDHGSGPTAH